MKCRPLVSVIVPVYNQEKYIGRCLRSLLDQSFPYSNYEVIVINDASEDRTTYALNLFQDGAAVQDNLSGTFRCIRVISNETNQGLSAALNKGIGVSEAPLVVRVDADDYVNANFLNFLHLYLEQNPHRDAVACDYLKVDDSENVLGRYNCMDDPIACGIMFRKEQLVDIGLYDPTFHCQEDRDLRIRFEAKYKVSRLELPLYRYRRHESNMTNNIEAMSLHEAQLRKKHDL